MRSTRSRIIHALSFELIGLAIVIPAFSLLFGVDMGEGGVVAVVGATLATVWNYLYNLGFDHALLRLQGHTTKSLPVRILHALLFEAGLLLALLPFIAWYLGVSLWQALQMDIAFALFYLVYAFVFNWLYDLIDPPRRPA
ncbi:PACE efflux transporter [Vannielia litorea]|uniref:PACE efflux transporter n=1 Tax=Vannielia litorea TaxID=1217970 RepID=UPI001C946B86|nr:PACE efflux transporter [Vannielia litorea]MBY6152526.1 PACE efflux transporter [Vannielia litorea]